MNVGDLTVTNIETIEAFDIATGAYRFSLDELQSSKIANTQEKTDVTGRGGRKLNSLKKNKGITVSGTNGVMSSGLMEVQTGGKFIKMDNAPVKWSDYLTISNNTATTSYKAVGTTGNEIERVYVKNADGTIEEILTQDSAASQGKFSYSPETKALTFKDSEYEDGTEIVVYYMRHVKGEVLENSANTFSEKCQVYVNALAEDACHKLYRVQFYIPRADFSGNFDIDMGDNQTVHAFEAESLASSRCGAKGSLWTYTVFGVTEGDAA